MTAMLNDRRNCTGILTTAAGAFPNVKNSENFKTACRAFALMHRYFISSRLSRLNHGGRAA